MSKGTVAYLLAERMIRDAMRRGCHLINIRCHPREKFFADKGEFFDMVEDGENSPIRLRNHSWVLGVTIREEGKDSPYISLPVSLFLPLLDTFSEKTVYKGRQGFAIYSETSRTILERLFEVTLYLEIDSSISIEFKEIES